ncbi:MAG: L-seryl-tRNA(Sec) selenium transferase [Oscillospiraceae bacterium]|nr:L-seryl-tRNA(Sec) selenium transferase [Oscillospiraceae bacterium]
MSINQSLLRQIPKVDELLESDGLRTLRETVPHSVLMEQVRAVLDELRGQILREERQQLPSLEEIVEIAAGLIRRSSQKSLRRVINATGVVLHTNLGRARLCAQAAQAVGEIADGYSNLEYNLAVGKRGSRYDHVEEILCKLTGAESAMVVNNNAAAVLLILSAMTRGKEVVISRGELVEIGGSFRVPDIMEQSGGILKEVGTTNKTHLRDYVAAIDPDRTGALLKVHTSNYRILGFTESVGLPQLVELGRQYGLPVIYDVGSGALLDFSACGLSDEPTVVQSIKEGADVVSFSGDKLLGGPQAGIIVGKKEYLDLMKRHPLTRAFRVDKMTLAALEETLRLYLDEERAKREIPTLRMLLAPEEELLERAEYLCGLLQQTIPGICASIEHENGQVGGGSMPGQLLPGYAVAVSPTDCSAAQLEKRLREWDTPLVGRIAHDRFLLDVRTMEPAELEPAAAALRACLGRQGREGQA